MVVQLKAKDPEALSYLYDHYGGAIYGIIARIIEDEAVADEVLQDAFLKFWNKIDQYDPTRGRLFTWMANLSRNLAIDKLRSKEMKNAGKTDPIESFVTSIDRSTDSMPNIDGIGLKELMNSLREEERFILEMTYFKGYTHSEIAEAYELPIGTVKTRLRMGIKNLRAQLNIK